MSFVRPVNEFRPMTPDTFSSNQKCIWVGKYNNLIYSSFKNLSRKVMFTFKILQACHAILSALHVKVESHSGTSDRPESTEPVECLDARGSPS